MSSKFQEKSSFEAKSKNGRAQHHSELTYMSLAQYWSRRRKNFFIIVSVNNRRLIVHRWSLINRILTLARYLGCFAESIIVSPTASWKAETWRECKYSVFDKIILIQYNNNVSYHYVVIKTLTRIRKAQMHVLFCMLQFTSMVEWDPPVKFEHNPWQQFVTNFQWYGLRPLGLSCL